MSLLAADAPNRLLPPTPPTLPRNKPPPELWATEAPPPSCARPNEGFPAAMATSGLVPPEELVATSGFLERSKEKVVVVMALLEVCSVAPRTPLAAPSTEGRRGREGCCCCCGSEGVRLVVALGVMSRDADCGPDTPPRRPMAGSEEELEDAGVREEREEKVVVAGALQLARLTAAGASDR